MRTRGIAAVLALALMCVPAKAQETLGTGALDTVLGYWGLTSVSGNSVPNCTTGLTYSTATHLFSCNASAGFVTGGANPSITGAYVPSLAATFGAL